VYNDICKVTSTEKRDGYRRLKKLLKLSGKPLCIQDHTVGVGTGDTVGIYLCDA
jgi:hypothetical protein